MTQREDDSVESAPGNGASEDIQEVIRRNEAKFTIYHSGPAQLLLDLDGPEALEKYEKVYPILKPIFGLAKLSQWKSRNGNTHIVLTLSRRLNAEKRFLLQAALGSDLVKEALSLKRLDEGQDEPSILFRPKR